MKSRFLLAVSPQTIDMTEAKGRRYGIIDAARAVAIINMTAYHLCYDILSVCPGDDLGAIYLLFLYNDLGYLAEFHPQRILQGNNSEPLRFSDIAGNADIHAGRNDMVRYTQLLGSSHADHLCVERHTE